MIVKSYSFVFALYQFHYSKDLLSFASQILHRKGHQGKYLNEVLALMIPNHSLRLSQRPLGYHSVIGTLMLSSLHLLNTVILTVDSMLLQAWKETDLYSIEEFRTELRIVLCIIHNNT